MKSPLLFVANWKTYYSHQQTLHWCANHKKELLQLAHASGHHLVICPIATTFGSLTPLFSDSPIKLAGQSCSAYSAGAHTGEITAQSFKEAGCSYCLVGHSERRTEYHESNETVAHQALQVIMQNMTPIICVGETEHERTQGKTTMIITEQLSVVLKLLQEKNFLPSQLIVAYEPVWAIGSGKTARTEEIGEVFDLIIALAQNSFPSVPVTLLYGGSIDDETVKALSSLEHLGGFLIGKASLDFQKLQKIVTWFNN